MIKVWRRAKMAELLDLPVEEIDVALERKSEFCRELRLHDPRPGGKDRDVLSVTGPLRKFQDRLYRRVLLRHLVPSAYSFGGVKGRSIVSNASPHIGSGFLHVADVSNFYPSISHQRVFRLFREAFDWPEEVSRICTELCTYDHHLALGLVTSPIIADQMMKPIDAQIGQMCARYRAVYSRFVDDMAISAPFDLKSTPIPDKLRKIVQASGFLMKKSKTRTGAIDDLSMSITKIRLKRDHLDVTQEYIERLKEQFDAARCVARGQAPQMPYYPRTSVLGRVRFVLWINPGRRDLMHEFRAIDWRAADRNAMSLGLIWKRPHLVAKH